MDLFVFIYIKSVCIHILRYLNLYSDFFCILRYLNVAKYYICMLCILYLLTTRATFARQQQLYLSNLDRRLFVVFANYQCFMPKLIFQGGAKVVLLLFTFFFLLTLVLLYLYIALQKPTHTQCDSTHFDTAQANTRK